MRSLAPIARLGVVHGHWHARRTLMPPTRKIAFHHRQSLRGALHRVRLETAPGRSWNVCDHYPASAVPTRSPPHHARSSPRLRSARIWMPLFVVDQVLRRHRADNHAAAEECVAVGGEVATHELLKGEVAHRVCGELLISAESAIRHTHD